MIQFMGGGGEGGVVSARSSKAVVPGFKAVVLVEEFFPLSFGGLPLL